MQEDDLPADDPRRGGVKRVLKHTLTVKEAIKEHEREKSIKIPRTLRTKLTGFQLVTKGRFQWLGSGCSTQIMDPKRNPTKADLFFGLIPPDVYTKMIDNMLTCRVPGAHQIKPSDIQQYFGLRAFIHGKHKSTIKETFAMLRKEFGEDSMAHKRWERIQRAWLCPEAVKVLNEASQTLVLATEVITIDEKLKPYSGESPYKRYVPNKDPPSGHWITETTVKGATTGLPFLVNCYPVQQPEGPTCLELYKACLDWIPLEKRKDIVVVTDAYYMDNASRLWLRSSGFMYLASINPTRFKEVWEPLKMKVKKQGKVAVAWNKDTGEAAVHCWTFEKRKTFLLTNAFKWEKSNDNITSDVFDVAYKHTFNTVDRLNHIIWKKGYPFRREGWNYSFDDFHYTTLLWNTYLLWHESQQITQRVKWREFCQELGKEIVAKVMHK
jgi:hypothetical protein